MDGQESDRASDDSKIEHSGTKSNNRKNIHLNLGRNVLFMLIFALSWPIKKFSALSKLQTAGCSTSCTMYIMAVRYCWFF